MSYVSYLLANYKHYCTFFSEDDECITMSDEAFLDLVKYEPVCLSPLSHFGTLDVYGVRFINEHCYVCIIASCSFYTKKSVSPEYFLEPILAEDNPFETFGTDLQLGKYDIEVANGNGYYNSDGYYVSYGRGDE